ncbi:MAG: hypothetical protein ACM3NS_06555 [Deltaproteobacteria bacterium]
MIGALSTLYVLLALAALLQAPTRLGRLALVGLVPYAVAMASYAVTAGSIDPRAIAAAARVSGAAFFAVNSALLALGAVLAAVVALGALREHARSPGALVLLAVSGFTLWRLRPPVAASGTLRVALILASAGAALGLLAVLLQRVKRSNRQEDALQWAVLRERPAVRAAFVAGAAGVVFGPHVALVFGGLMMAAAADRLARRARGHADLPWLPVATLGLLPVWWLLATIAGPVGLGTASLGDVPLSPRAEILLALPLALVVWSCLGLWPAHRLFSGGLLAPLAVALWLRVARPALADGLAHWQPVLMPLGVVGVWAGALGGRGSAILNALAFVALASGAAGSTAALLLAAAALALAASPGLAGPQAVRRLADRLAWGIAILALPLLLKAGLRTQVTYTLAAAGGAALALWLGPGLEGDDRAAAPPADGVSPA